MAYTCNLKNIITMMKGSSYSDTLTIKHPDPLYPNDRTKDIVTDLSDYTVRSQVRTLNGALLFSFVCTITDAVNGIVTRVASPADTALGKAYPAPAQHVWGIEFTNTTTGYVIPEGQGGVLFEQEVVI